MANADSDHGRTLAVCANAERNGRTTDLDAAIDSFCDEWNLGTADRRRFEQEYLLAVATRR